ncbi:MAG: MBL fold metallo-hydrolase, partial [Candidatus Methylomirabilales bacterium]
MIFKKDFSITWYGHSTFKIVSPKGKHILIDPWVTGNPACPQHLKKVDRVDLILIAHGHFDHMADAVTIARAHSPKVVGIYEVAAWLEGQGVGHTRPMNMGGTQE